MRARQGFNPNNGIGDAYNKIKGHPNEAAVHDALRACEAVGRGLAMVDSRKGVTNLHVPVRPRPDTARRCILHAVASSSSSSLQRLGYTAASDPSYLNGCSRGHSQF